MLNTKAATVAVASIFSPRVFSILGSRDASDAFGRISNAAEHLDIQNSPNLTVGGIFQRSYAALSEDYRSEYFFKNTLISKIVFGRHSPRTATALVEQPARASIADLAVINGTITAYEIKTDLDSFSRIGNQVRDYASCFERVNVVTTLRRSEQAADLVPEWVGVVAVLDNGALRSVRTGRGGLDRIDIGSAFELLRVSEVKNVARALLPEIPDWPTGSLYPHLKRLIINHPREVVYPLIVRELKQRGTAAATLASSSDFPASMRALAYKAPLNETSRGRLLERLSQPVPH